MDNEKKIEIPFGAFDSELIRQEINIPDGFNAVIDGNKIILTRAESEDERIRKGLINYFNHHKNGINIFYGIKGDDILAWLEKQGEEQPIIRWHSINEEPEEMKELFCEWESDDATWHDVAFYDKESHTFRHAKMPINVTKWVYVDELLEEQAEVESDNDDIEVEEKGIRKAFNKIENEKQCKKPQRMISAEAKEAMYKKPADKVEPKFKVGDSIKTANEEPLTITEITDNGYWSEDLFICNFDDAAKWELVEQKPAWSIKEKLMLNDIIETTERSNIFKENYQRELIDWLKSLKTRYTWKPSDAQMASITCAVRKMKESACYDSELVSLLNDLKKLK